MKLWNPSTWFEKKESATGAAVSAVNVGQPVWTPRNYEHFAKESYQQNAIAFRCIEMTAQAVAGIPVLIKSGDDILDSHPILELLAHPAPMKTQTWLMESIATYLQIAGNSYVESVGPSSSRPPQELWSLRPDRMKVVVGKGGVPSGYKYTAHGRDVDFDVDQITGQSDILHIKKFNPIDDWYGMSAVEPASYAVDRHNEAGAHNMAVLQNGATPSGAMVFKPITQDGSVVSAPQDVIEAAEKRLMERFTGSKNAGKPLVLGGNVDWISYGMTMEQLQLNESKMDAARDICVAFGVPIELLLPGQSTFNNKREAKLSFYEETVLPMANGIYEHLNIWLAPRFGEGFQIIPDLDAIQALSLRREIRQENTIKLYDSGLIDRDEGRVALQFEAQPELPQRKIDAGVLSALVNAAQTDELMGEPLYRYLMSVGLVDRGTSYEDYLATAVNLLDNVDVDNGDEGNED